MGKPQRRCIGCWILILAAGVVPGPGRAQSDAAAERVREALRQTTLQLREAQDENAAIKVKLQTLNQRLELLQVQPPAAPPPPAKSRPADAGLRRALQEQTALAAKLQQQLEEAQKSSQRWHDAAQKAADAAHERDAAASKYQALAGESDQQSRRCSADNAALIGVSRELLQRYQHKGVWDAVRAEEPLTQLHRVQLETIAQRYEGRIKDATVAPPSPLAAPQTKAGTSPP